MLKPILKLLFLIVFLFAIGQLFYHTPVQGSGTYTPSTSFEQDTVFTSDEIIIKNIRNYFSFSFAELSAFGVDRAWKLKKDSATIMTIFSMGTKAPYKTPQFNKELYVKALPETRYLLHKLAGIKDWTVQRAELIKNTNGDVLIKLKGHYFRSGYENEEKVIFHEWHKFKGKKFTQIQLIQNRLSTSALSDQVVGALFTSQVQL